MAKALCELYVGRILSSIALRRVLYVEGYSSPIHSIFQFIERYSDERIPMEENIFVSAFRGYEAIGFPFTHLFLYDAVHTFKLMNKIANDILVKLDDFSHKYFAE